MSKLAACVSKADLDAFFTEAGATVTEDLVTLTGPKVLGLFNLKQTLQKRPECETDESVVQILPYITLVVEEEVNGTKVNKYLTYRRPITGDENRLHGKLSLGWGGHIELTHESANMKGFVFTSECLRELREELSIFVFDVLVKNALTHSAVLYYQPNDEVGKYHLCVSLVIKINKNIHRIRPKTQEAINVAYLTKEEILTQNSPADIEAWSDLVIGNLS